MTFIEAVLQNPNQITFATLFVALFYWQIKTSREREMLMMQKNEEREANMQRVNAERELKYQVTIDKLMDSLQDVEQIKVTVEKINEKLD